MPILVFVESDEGSVKASSLEAVSYAAELAALQGGGDVVAIALGEIPQTELEAVGKSGASRVLYVNEPRLKQGIIQAYAAAISQAMEAIQADILVLTKSSLGDPVAARTAVKMNAALASNVTALPDLSQGFVVKQSIYTGKAFSFVEMQGDKKIIAIKKNTLPLKNDGAPATVEPFDVSLTGDDFNISITATEKASGEVLLPEADIVVSGGRGMKDPENWHLIEDLAKTLGAATGCSKPVSDMNWRPHHEHVGQTGVKVSPNLYIAVGISGAIQHLAGVNSSKNILVINKDPEAPFFKAADYGVVGDAFEILPKLTAAIKASRN